MTILFGGVLANHRGVWRGRSDDSPYYFFPPVKYNNKWTSGERTM